MNELLEIIVELLNMLESNACTQPAKSDGHEHVLFDNIDRDRITKIRARIKAAQQGVQPTLLTLCPECGVEQIVTHLPTCAHYVAQSG